MVARSSKYGLIRVKYRLFSYDVTEAMLLHQNKSRNQFWNRTDFLSTNVLLLQEICIVVKHVSENDL